MTTWEDRLKNCYTITHFSASDRGAYSLAQAKAIAKDLVAWYGGVAHVTSDYTGKVVGSASIRNGRNTYRSAGR